MGRWRLRFKKDNRLVEFRMNLANLFMVVRLVSVCANNATLHDNFAL